MKRRNLISRTAICLYLLLTCVLCVGCCKKYSNLENDSEFILTESKDTTQMINYEQAIFKIHTRMLLRTLEQMKRMDTIKYEGRLINLQCKCMNDSCTYAQDYWRESNAR